MHLQNVFGIMYNALTEIIFLCLCLPFINFLFRYAMNLPSSCRFLLFFGVVVRLSFEKENELHIGTLIPRLFSGDPYRFKMAMELANETIHSQGLLKGYKLVFHHKETSVRTS